MAYMLLWRLANKRLTVQVAESLESYGVWQRIRQKIMSQQTCIKNFPLERA